MQRNPNNMQQHPSTKGDSKLFGYLKCAMASPVFRKLPCMVSMRIQRLNKRAACLLKLHLNSSC
jgi:hypothetical protein